MPRPAGRVACLLAFALCGGGAISVWCSGCAASGGGGGGGPEGNDNGSDNGTTGDDNAIVPADDGTVTTVAGVGFAGFAGDGGIAAFALLDSPMDVEIAEGFVWIADFNNHRVRRVELATGVIETVAGTGQQEGDGALSFPTDVTPLTGGAFLVVSWGDHRVYRYEADGSRSIIAGTGEAACSTADDEPPAAEQPSFAPRSTDVLADGSVLISEQGCHQVRRVTADGRLLAYSGTGEAGYSGDDDAGTEALLHAAPIADGPSFGLALSPEDPPDELFIADTANNVIRAQKTFSGRITTLAGSGAAGYQDGSPLAATFDNPTSVYSSSDHAVWIADTNNNVIRRVDPLVTEVRTVMGTGEPGFNGDGLPPPETMLDHPTAVFVTEDGVVFVADRGNHCIRQFQFTGQR